MNRPLDSGCAALGRGCSRNSLHEIHVDWLEQYRTPVRREVALNEAAWTLDQSRQSSITVQRHTQSIFLRRAARAASPERPLNDVQDSEPTGNCVHFPIVMALLSRLASQLGGELGRAMLVRLAPGQVVYPHIDKGAYYASRDRFHYVVASAGGSCLAVGNAQATMHTGQLWWFDNKQMHSSRNDSDLPRDHLIFDLLIDDATAHEK